MRAPPITAHHRRVQRILVTGATGSVGSRTVERLSAAPDVVVRAAAHRLNGESRRHGVENVELGFEDPTSVRRAMADVDVVFLVTPCAPNQVELATTAVDGVVASGVRRLVRLSGFGADRPDGVEFMRQHTEIERYIAVSGIPYTFVRPQLCMDNFIHNCPPGPDGTIRLPWGTARVSLIDARDVADFAAHVLTTDGHTGRTYTITGPAPLTVSEIATAISDATGHPVTYRDTTEADARRGLLDQGKPACAVNSLLALFASCKAGRHAAVTSTLTDVTGERPRTFTEFAHDNAHTWRCSP